MPLKYEMKIRRRIGSFEVESGNMQVVITPVNLNVINVTIRSDDVVISDEYYGKSQDDIDDLYSQQKSSTG